MSLTSYRAAPPRVKPALGTEEQVGHPAIGGRTRGTGVCHSGCCSAYLPACLFAMVNPLGRPGGDLLFHALRRSTIGAEGFHGRVRDGIGWGTLARTTRSSQRTCHRSRSARTPGSERCLQCVAGAFYVCAPEPCRCAWMGSQANRVISTGKLHALPRFHTRPINVVVYHDSQGRPGLEGGFPLRCFQRLSLPYIATQLCRWRDNWSTRGTSTPVLSY